MATGNDGMRKTNTVILISCVSKKLGKEAKARDLYVSTLFKLNLQYAESLDPDFIFILSAKYGLLSLDETVAPYDWSLNDMRASERKAWANNVIKQLNEVLNIKEAHFVFLAGQKYRQYLIPPLSFYEIPLQGLRIGEQLQHLKRQVAK